MSAPAGTNYSELSPELIIATLEQLTRRVGERFPKAGLFKVSAHLLKVADRSRQSAEASRKPIMWVRWVTGLFLAIVLVCGAVSLAHVEFAEGKIHFADWVQGVEASINDAIFIAAGLFFLFTIERRIKRRAALKALHELRSLAHVVDMHQLTKDPQRFLAPLVATASSPPKPELTTEELVRYLDYCSELLSLIGKLAALFVQHFDDALVLATVDEIEQLTNGLSRKIWQKVMIIQAAPAGG